MALDSEIERNRKDPERWRNLARQLLDHASPNALSDWEMDFLESILSRKWLDELSYRQAESLLEIRDDCRFVSSLIGFSVSAMIQLCYENRLELDEADHDWIVELRRRSSTTVRRNEARRLLRLMGRVDAAAGWGG